MEFTVKDLSISIEPESPFMRLTVGGRAYSTSALMDADDLERIARVFNDQARKLRGD
jgi:hypothetical protein